MSIRRLNRVRKPLCSSVVLSLAAVLGAAERPPTGDYKDWPNWRGPFYNGCAVDSTVPLHEDLSKSRLVWRSEDKIPPGDDSVGVYMTGGYGSPIIVGNLAILQYFYPSGTVRAHGKDGKPIMISRGAGFKEHQDFAADKARILADDIIHAFDMTNGKTVWKTVFKEQGVNTNGGSQKGGGHFIPCYDRGRLFAIGTTGRVYAVDVKTGATLWQSDNGTHHQLLQKRVEVALKKKKFMQDATGRGGYTNACPLVAGGVVVMPMAETGTDKAFRKLEVAPNGLMGFDAETGEVLWRVPNCLANFRSPIRWTHAGKDYVIACGSKATCIDPHTGDILWATAPVGYGRNTPGVWNDYLVSTIICLKMSPSGAKVVWNLSKAAKANKGEHPQGSGYCSTVIHKGIAYYPDRKNRIWSIAVKTGQLVTHETARWSTYSTSPVVSNDTLYFIHGKYGPDVAAKIGDGSVQMIPPYKFPDNSPGLTPAIARGLMVFRENTRLVCYDLRVPQ